MVASIPIVSLLCSYHVCAGHRLFRPDWSQEQNNKAFGKCANQHGHQYRIDLVVQGKLSEQTGMLINGYDVDAIAKPVIMDQLDHKYLNEDVEFFKGHLPTAEWIAYWVYEQLKKEFPVAVLLKQVRVYETPELAAIYPVE